MGIVLDQLKGRATRQLAVLVDPDRLDLSTFDHENLRQADMILVGSSLLNDHGTEEICRALKAVVECPVILFPGNSYQVCPSADAILFMSLISGRNPEFLISQQVYGAPLVKKAGIEPISTGYMLIGSENHSAAAYVSQTQPIPQNKIGIATATALAGQYLGMSAIYLEGGSGAKHPVSAEMIKTVKSATDTLLFVGGGLRTPQQAEAAWDAGADVVVIGTVLEQDPSLLADFLKAR